MCSGLLVYGKVVVEFGRKVFLVDCPLWKNMAKNKHIRTHSWVLMQTNTLCVTIQGNTTAVRNRNDVIQSILLHIRDNLGMMLAWDYASCHVARSTLAKTQMACKKSGFKSYQPLVGPIETQGSCTTTATKSQRVHLCYSSDVCVHSMTVY